MIQVTLLDTVELATYTVRTFALYKVWHGLGCSWAAAWPQAEAAACSSGASGRCRILARTPDAVMWALRPCGGPPSRGRACLWRVCMYQLASH